MNSLTQNNIKLNWELALIGLQKDLISPSEVLKYIDVKYIEDLDSKIITKLYTNEKESNLHFADIIKEEFIKKEDLSEYLSVWSISLLADIYKSKLDINEKLKEIANLWEEFDYIDEWKNFIYYMPSLNKETCSIESVYSKFISFLNRELENLDKKKYIIKKE